MLKNKTLNAKRRLLELDALRGIAALSVVLFHYTVIVYRFVPEAKKSVIEFSYGHYGVELFFIISGFVIFLSLTRSKSGLDFLVARAARIYPVFWVSVLLTYTIGILAPLEGQTYTISQLLANLTMLHGYMKIPSIDGVYWSLTYEIGFYICVGLLFISQKLKYISELSIFWIISSIGFHFFSNLIPHPLHYITLINSYAHLFVAGITLYRCWTIGFSLKNILLLAGVITVQYIQDGLLGAVIISSFILVFILIILDYSKVLKNRFLIYLGNISYSLYLIHHMIGFQIIKELQSLKIEANITVLITILTMISLATGLTYFIERPALQKIKSMYKQHLNQ